MNFLWLVVIILNSLLTETVSEKMTPFCSNETSGNGEVTVLCHCPTTDRMIVQDTNITHREKRISLDPSTTHWEISNCSEVHLSGSTLLSLTNLSSLTLRYIDLIHFHVNFFSQYNTQLEVLAISHSNLHKLEGSLNLHAQKLKTLMLDHMTWEEPLNILLLTEEHHAIDLIAISNNKIKTLGEINLSSRHVHQFLLENNTINNILPSAIFHDSNYTAILGNSIENLNLLSVEVSTYNFTLRNNTFQRITCESIKVNNATSIQVVGNTFFHIERNSFVWLRPITENGSTMFAENHFYEYDRGSLLFYHTIYNRHLEIHLNVMHTSTCDCDTVDLIKKMTEADNDTIKDFHKQRFTTYEMLRESSACMDENGEEYTVFVLCDDSKLPVSWVPVTIAFLMLVPICGILLLYMERQYKCLKRRNWSLNSRDVNPFNYSANMAYEDDSENDEYVARVTKGY